MIVITTYYYNYITKKQKKKKNRACYLYPPNSGDLISVEPHLPVPGKGKVVPHFWVRFPYSPERSVA